ncbi:Pc15g00460 [Penicillium rubens Wisconsin 54-1255]|uniref:Pc15g00460 protein n=1 Tax=Penicillium rubens (strain ATCC 28089 / DSM 1075 / NRRL 1951 / Wisconsin 54-1255) TaxID=500485 RepID=B6H6J2_PENRW|nr:Pc15g00460 [Penicillium rubens Wisconsin 54-1255]
MIEITNKYLRLSTQNEAATRCIINDILFALLDTVVPYPNNGQWPLNLQMETSLTSPKGTCDYTLWYGDKGGADKAINLVLVEAKKLGLASQGDDQALGYMACVHQERRTQPSQNSTVYGLSTDGEEFRFLRINERSEFTKVIMTKTPGGNYSRITSMIAFIMREAVSQSSYTSRNTSKDVSMEDDPVTLPPDV